MSRPSPRVRLMHRLQQRGDTIVEVLIAMAVMSLVLVGAYVTTNRNSATLQDNQEREQAQRLVESQIEMLRSNKGITSSGDCFSGPTETSTCNNISAAGSGATYTLHITGPLGTTNPPGVYTFSASWFGLHSNTNDSLTMYYRLD